MIDPNRKEYIRAVFAGSIASFISTLVSQPLQVIKINIQLTIKEKINTNTMVYVIRKIFRKDGLRGFWRGHMTSQWFGILHGVTLFSVYHESVQRLNKTRFKYHKNEKNYIAGFLAGTCSSIMFAPVDLINTRKMYGKSSHLYTSLYVGFKRIVVRNGILGLYRGVFINWAHLSNMIALKFLIYNGLCNYFGHNDNNITDDRDNMKAYSLVICGAIAGLLACTITFPCEVIKRQLHVSSLLKNKNCHNIRSCTKYVYVNNGLKGFFKGLSPALTKSCLVTGICFSAYDIVAPLLDFII